MSASGSSRYTGMVSTPVPTGTSSSLPLKSSGMPDSAFSRYVRFFSPSIFQTRRQIAFPGSVE